MGRIYCNIIKIIFNLKNKGDNLMSFQEQHQNYERPKISCGIYIITNLINNKVYIGKSNNI